MILINKIDQGFLVTTKPLAMQIAKHPLLSHTSIGKVYCNNASDSNFQQSLLYLPWPPWAMQQK
jgi:hypothetical protein